VFEELRTSEIEQPCHKGSPRNNLKPTDALRQVRPLLPCFPLVLYSSDLCLVRVPLMRRLTLVIGNKNLLDPIVSGTQPSPESIALRTSQQPFVITTTYEYYSKAVPKGVGAILE
jgi:hypothetical protein